MHLSSYGHLRPHVTLSPNPQPTESTAKKVGRYLWSLRLFMPKLRNHI